MSKRVDSQSVRVDDHCLTGCSGRRRRRRRRDDGATLQLLLMMLMMLVMIVSLMMTSLLHHLYVIIYNNTSLDDVINRCAPANYRLSWSIYSSLFHHIGSIT